MPRNGDDEADKRFKMRMTFYEEFRGILEKDVIDLYLMELDYNETKVREFLKTLVPKERVLLKSPVAESVPTSPSARSESIPAPPRVNSSQIPAQPTERSLASLRRLNSDRRAIPKSPTSTRRRRDSNGPADNFMEQFASPKKSSAVSLNCTPLNDPAVISSSTAAFQSQLYPNLPYTQQYTTPYTTYAQSTPYTRQNQYAPPQSCTIDRNQTADAIPLQSPKSFNNMPNEELRTYIHGKEKRVVIILRGLPGCGKSTRARKLIDGSGLHYSTDDFFFSQGAYRFDPSKLSQAHEWNQLRTKEAIGMGISPICIDNTNTQSWEMKPYVLMGERGGYEVIILEPNTLWAWDPSELALKNKHGVSKECMERMKDRYEKGVTVDRILNTAGITPKIDLTSTEAPAEPVDERYMKPIESSTQIAERRLDVTSPSQIVCAENPLDTQLEYVAPPSDKQQFALDDVDVRPSKQNDKPTPGLKNAIRNVFNKLTSEEDKPTCSKNPIDPVSIVPSHPGPQKDESDVEFLCECFPDKPPTLLRDWLQRYNGDVAKTCDYFARLTQVVIEVDNIESAEEPMEWEDSKEEEPYDILPPDGTAFLCDLNHGEGDSIKLAMNHRLAVKLTEMFGQPHELESMDETDLIVNMDSTFARCFYECWKNSIKTTSQPVDLEADEMLAKRLQYEENMQGARKKFKELPVTVRATEGESGFNGGIFDKSPWDVHAMPSRTFPMTPNTDIVDSTTGTLSAKQLSHRKKLHEKYPGVDEDSLNNILKFCGYDIKAAYKMVDSSCGHQSPRNVHATGSKIQSPKPKSPTKASDSNTSIYQTTNEEEQTYEDLRAEAELYQKLRLEAYEKSVQAHSQKNHVQAQHHNKQAHDFMVKMKDAHRRAANLTFLKRNKNYVKEKKVLDLHGLHVREALGILEGYIENARRARYRHIDIITGRGNHSKKYQCSPIKMNVIRYLQTRRIRYDLMNGGGQVRVFPS